MTAILILFLTRQLGIVRTEQEALLGHAMLVEESEQQLDEILSQPNQGTRLYATRFLLTPPYLPPVASVWFDIPDLTGGSLVALKYNRDVSNQDYVLDYEDGILYNLMPELQQSKRTIFLWRESPASARLLYENKSRVLEDEEVEFDQILGVAGNNRFGIAVQAAEAGWVSLQYDVNIPIESQLAFGLFPHSQQSYRVRAVDGEGESRLLYSLDAKTEAADWLDVYLPLERYEGQDVEFYFDFQAGRSLEAQGFWANPRLIIN